MKNIITFNCNCIIEDKSKTWNADAAGDGKMELLLGVYASVIDSSDGLVFHFAKSFVTE